MSEKKNMTRSQQKRFYFPAWNACAQANGWMMARGRLAIDPEEQANRALDLPDPARGALLLVLGFAAQLALPEVRAMIAEDLRHACNLVATDRRCASSTRMTYTQLNRAVDLFALLRDPNDLQAVSDWLHAGQSFRRRYLEYLESLVNEAALIAICRSRWDSSDWRSRTIDELLWLGRQIKERPANRPPRWCVPHGPSRKAIRYETDPAKVPF